MHKTHFRIFVIWILDFGFQKFPLLNLQTLTSGRRFPILVTFEVCNKPLYRNRKQNTGALLLEVAAYLLYEVYRLVDLCLLCHRKDHMISDISTRHEITKPGKDRNLSRKDLSHAAAVHDGRAMNANIHKSGEYIIEKAGMLYYEYDQFHIFPLVPAINEVSPDMTIET